MESRRGEAFRNRNMWMWYSVAFYLYGIFDAWVDANLHDARVKMKLEPDLNPQTKEIGLHASMISNRDSPEIDGIVTVVPKRKDFKPGF